MIMRNILRRGLATTVTMKGVACEGFGGPEVLKLKEYPIPSYDPKTECLIKVEASALNRADVVQRKGNYPPPKGVTDILGLECAGYLLNNISELKDGAYKKNKRVMAILPGGGNATIAKANKGEVMDIPSKLSFEEAASIPETWITAYQLVHWLGQIKEGDNVLIHAGASGVGTSATQLVKHAKANSISVCSSAKKISACKTLGASFGINYKETKDFSKEVLKKGITNGHGADIILDCIVGTHFEENLKSLAEEGRWVIYGFMGGSKIPPPKLTAFFAKRATITFTSLRMRTQAYRDKLVAEFAKEKLSLFNNGSLKPIIDQIYSINDVISAHKRMESNETIGKIILRVD